MTDKQIERVFRGLERAVAAIEALPAALLAGAQALRPTCPNCKGSGRIAVGGPWRDFCDKCGGSGKL